MILRHCSDGTHGRALDLRILAHQPPDGKSASTRTLGSVRILPWPVNVLPRDLSSQLLSQAPMLDTPNGQIKHRPTITSCGSGPPHLSYDGSCDVLPDCPNCPSRVARYSARCRPAGRRSDPRRNSRFQRRRGQRCRGRGAAHRNRGSAVHDQRRGRSLQRAGATAGELLGQCLVGGVSSGLQRTDPTLDWRRGRGQLRAGSRPG